MSDLKKLMAEELLDGLFQVEHQAEIWRRLKRLEKCEAECWFVESRPEGNFEGWWAGPPKGEGGWLTTDPLKAKRYTEAEAIAVATALSYFPSPFRWSKWVATEHVFMDAARAALEEK